MYRVWMALVCLWMGFSQAHSGLSEIWDKVYEALGSPVEACGYDAPVRSVKIKNVSYLLYSCQIFDLSVNQASQDLQKIGASSIENPDDHVQELQSRWKAKGYAIESRNVIYYVYLIPNEDQISVLLEVSPSFLKNPILPSSDGFSKYTCYFVASDLERFLDFKIEESKFEVSFKLGNASQYLEVINTYEKGSDVMITEIDGNIKQIQYVGKAGCDQGGACYLPVSQISTLLVVQRELYATKFIKNSIEVKDRNGKRFTFKPYCWTGEKMFSLN